MNSTTNKSTVSINRIRSIQSSWTADERQRRAEKAHRRTRELFALLLSARDDDNAIAVGAPACEDLRRLAG